MPWVSSDGDRIRNLLGRYCDLMDAGDFTGVGELFAHGVVADEHGAELARGAGAVAAFYASTTRRHAAGTPLTKHLVANTILDEPGADDDDDDADDADNTTRGSVLARSSYLVLQAAPGLPLQPIITGRYLDRFRQRADGTWHFAERRFYVDQLGDLSQHLNVELR